MFNLVNIQTMKYYFICVCTIGLALSVRHLWRNATPTGPTLSMAVCQTFKYASSRAHVVESCDPKHLLLYNERCKECMYLKSKGQKTIAVGFDLDSTQAKSIISQAGANYDKIVSGQPTKYSTKCDCDSVPCLNQTQIEYIFDRDLENAIANAKTLAPSFESLCCRVQDTVVDISFALGKAKLLTFKLFFHYLENQNWKAAADYLRTTKWCHVDAVERCEVDAGNVEDGCPCSGQYHSCYSTSHQSCCMDNQTCCNASVTFESYVKQPPFAELLCCDLPNAICCHETDTCCPLHTPTCCSHGCCAADNECRDGKCIDPNGKPNDHFPAGNIAPVQV